MDSSNSTDCNSNGNTSDSTACGIESTSIQSMHTSIAQMQQDHSRSRIERDWASFSFENDLSIRKDCFLHKFNDLRLLSNKVYMDKSKEAQDECRNKLAVIDTGFRNSHEEYGKLSADVNTVRNDLKKIKESNEILKTKIQALEKVLESLQKDESTVSSDYKLDKVSYRKALKFYSLHTDMNIDIKEKSENLLKCAINFVSDVEHEATILVTVDKLQRKIIDLSCSELPTRDVNEDTGINLANMPGVLCTLREKLINTTKK